MLHTRGINMLHTEAVNSIIPTAMLLSHNTSCAALLQLDMHSAAEHQADQVFMLVHQCVC